MVSEYDQRNYMQFLRDVKPNWTESQIYYSTKAHFGKSFTLYEPKFEKFEEVCYADTPDDSWTVKELNAYIEEHELDISLRLKKAEKIEAINRI